MQSVAAIKRDDLVKYHDTWFKPNNATLIVVGDTTLAEIRPKLESLFARWQRGDVPMKRLADARPPDGPRVYLIDRPGSEQSMIIAGELKCDAAKIKGVPRLMAGAIGPAVEAFLVATVKPNLVSVAKGVEAYLRENKK